MPPSNPEDIGLANRLRQICDSKFGGSTPKMAEALGLSQPAVWRAVNGKHIPSGTFLAGLARFADVDLNWLFRGQGDQPKPNAELAIPISQRLLDGKPREHQDQLSGSFVPVAAGDYAPTRYFLEVQPDEPIRHSEEMKVRVRDLLLMETDRRRFPPRDRLFHLCGFRVKGRRAAKLKLGFVDFVPDDPEEGAAHLVADTFALAIKKSQLIRKTVIVERPGQRPVVRIQNYIATKGGETPVSDFEREPASVQVAYDDLVAVCVGLTRRRVSYLA